jgi:predicted TIM-barrel fold metal-dependent hydrolase
MIPECPAPLDPVPPLVKTPPGACDTHAHVFGPSDQFPYGPDRSYTPSDAPLEKYLHMLETQGFT